MTNKKVLMPGRKRNEHVRKTNEMSRMHCSSSPLLLSWILKYLVDSKNLHKNSLEANPLFRKHLHEVSFPDVNGWHTATPHSSPNNPCPSSATALSTLPLTWHPSLTTPFPAQTRETQAHYLPHSGTWCTFPSLLH